jgi:HlyD family secretion protein
MWRRGKRIRWPIIGVAAIALAGSGTAYAVTNNGPAANYRTVGAAKGDVDQTLSTNGTVDAARRADLEFATSGTVARLLVAVGDTVKAGQVIAVLDTGELKAAVTRAEATLAQAFARLASDRAAQDDTVAAASTTPSGSMTKPQNNTPSTGGSSTTAAVLAELKKQQDDVLTAQSAATAAMAAAKEALAAQTEACATAFQDTSPTPSAQDSGDSTANATADTTAAKAAAATDADNAACTAALTEVQQRQDDVKDAQDALATALNTLSTTLTKALATLSASGSNPSASARTSASSSASADSTTPSSSSPTGSSGGAVTAAQLASDQAQIEQAKADLVSAQQLLAQATLRSSRSGKVVSLGATLGGDVSAGDTAAVVVGGKAVTVTATVDESKIDQVKVGQVVRVTTPGESASVDGTVSAIGLVADSSSGTTTYPVTVSVEDPTIALPTGSAAAVEIVLGTVKDVVTVPISAIVKRGTGTFVRTWDGTNLTQKSVTLGAMGNGMVEVTQGLAAGDRVVLADVDQAITGASDTVNNRGGFGGNGGPSIKFSGPGGGPPVTFSRAN